MELRPADFAAFFRTIHGCGPFPWQQRLVDHLAGADGWPDALDLPTGSGKTAALDAAVFHLALRADAPRKAALRIALVVDRRLVVDDAFARAERIAKALRGGLDETAGGCAVLAEVARRLRRLAGADGPPLVARRLRGGVPLEGDWARTPTQPTVLCSTVDQVGSRLLFRGYGVSDSMKPVHAGLLGTDSLILLDEAHLAEPFRQTLGNACALGRAKTKVALLSATPGKTAAPFALSAEDRTHPELRKRLEARKPVALKPPVRGVAQAAAEAFAKEARAMACRLRERGVSPAAVGVVVNRVALARDIFDALKGDDAIDAVLMIGRSRGVDRDAIADALAPFRTGGRHRADARPLFVVATQCLEVGVDLDLDGLVVQAASLDALRQRFGRLNRAGRPIDAEGAVIALAEDVARKADDPVYGDRIRRTWDALQKVAEDGAVDFGVEALPRLLKQAGVAPDDLASERPDAPVLMPAYLDLWSQTSPRPAADPEVSLFLHGAERTAAGVSVVWRGDISEADLADKARADDIKEVMRLVPPRPAETVELPLWVARGWLRHPEGRAADASDAPEREPQPRTGRSPESAGARPALRWAGADHSDTGIVGANDLRPGDLLVVPAGYGGCDRFGWAPNSRARVVDVADAAAKAYWGRRCAVRIARDVVRPQEWARISALLASEDVGSADLVARLLEALPTEGAEEGAQAAPPLRDVRRPLCALRRARGRIDVRLPYAGGSDGGAILVAERGIHEQPDPSDAVSATEDDAGSHAASRPVALDDHVRRVARFASGFADALGLDAVADDLRLAARLHDAGKADPRFQVMLAGGDPWNRPDGATLAKSGRSWSRQDRARAGLPRGWRHEALSVRMARTHPDLAAARDPALVLWLIGSHHGRGRPFFDFLDPAPEPPPPRPDVPDWRLPDAEPGPQSLGFDFGGADWPSLFADLKRRYGIWGLAHLEAILRLADHRASEEERAS